MRAYNEKLDSEKNKVNYESPDTIVYTLMTESCILNDSNNGEMGNGGFLNE